MPLISPIISRTGQCKSPCLGTANLSTSSQSSALCRRCGLFLKVRYHFCRKPPHLLPKLRRRCAHGEGDHYLLRAGVFVLKLFQVGYGVLRAAGEPGPVVDDIPEV